jgi:single-stranded-DNA-specific exonuclease
MLIREIDNELFNSYSDDIPNFLKKIYAARKITESQLSLKLNNLLKPDFAELDKALSLLEQALIQQKNILIIGDFDTDGATAIVVAIKSLRMMGAKKVNFLVPNRFEHGYGLSVKIVELAIKEKQPDLIITVDNGISSFDGVDLAKKSNINVIITDHHLPNKSLPKANAIINPNLTNCNFKSKNLAGVGVCFYLFSALKTHLKQKNYFLKNNIVLPDMKEVLDLVALGTIADVVKLDQNNRILVKEGIELIHKKKCSLGILALLEIANKSYQTANTDDLGFYVIPRINSAGRLKDITRGIQCLLTDDINDARRYAKELDELNQFRKKKQEQMQLDAENIIKQKSYKKEFAIVLFDDSWHEGIVGIVAGKLKDKYNCPCVIFAKANNILKGSIRSIKDVHIKDLLDLIDRENLGLILKFGGHAMAAGLTIDINNFSVFKKIFKQAVKNYLNNKIPTADFITDGNLDGENISLDNAKLLVNSAPWGQGFEEPYFFGNFIIHEQKILAEKHLKFRVQLIDDHRVHDAIAFFQNPIEQNKALMVYKLSINSWMGNDKLQLIINQINMPE